MSFKYRSNSREHQDLFVLSVLNGKQGGTYLEIGAAHPIIDNNTFLLENEFDWHGMSVEWDSNFANEFTKIRKNGCICNDATILDYDSIIESISPDNHIDFLQLDVDPPHITFQLLSKINFLKYNFSIITFEHDSWRGSTKERDASREILTSYGYTLVLSDVMHGHLAFEDWYVNEKYMKSDNWKRFKGHNIQMDAGSMSAELMNTLRELTDNI